ncbi:MAG: ATP-binding protein [Deltaproteobacteria bacterium CG_4_10_14_3_um_filter_51_14]|nr:ATP-binding protein [bacterium]OIP40844.1 MAG: hypothetical protein AUK25_07045 [Desulfobacteraceae bacterium CG2_30_51_40]PIY25720.1 MAG: ATP-binding protein [Deltaproteobacteria bacterium CG_4_10_14_3_um_filter_51_14]PJB38388.1 MAG: ATP-binding protein [Deltaproteobacteria bacterium CG_4_9_14_3_um_filter_51_14]
MRELALHILDIAENGINAGADLLEILVEESFRDNLLRISVRDNGRGIPKEMIQKVLDPFYTTRTTRRVGLGLSLMKEAAKRCDGDFQLESKEGCGTEVKIIFRRDHIDLAPLGDMTGSMISLIMGNPGVDFIYDHDRDGKRFRLDTREVKKQLDGGDITHPEVIGFLRQFMSEGLAEIKTAIKEE